MSRLKWVFVSLGLLVVVGGVAVGVTFYVVIGKLTNPPEETAKFLPPYTQFYLSVNLRPGVDQLSKLKKIFERFDQDKGFGDKVDDLIDQIEDESRINLREDVFPWLGPEISIAVLDLDTARGSADMVSFFGTRDAEATTNFLSRFLEYVKSEEGTDFEEGSYHGYLTYNQAEGNGGTEAHIGITDDYLVFATTQSLLENTLDMIDKPEASLADQADFKRAQEAVEDSRVALLYVNVDSIIDTLRSSIGELDDSVVEEIERNLPKFLSASVSFIDKGIKLATSYNTPEGAFGVSWSNPVKAADYLPENTLALISTGGARQVWDQFKQHGLKQIAEFRGVANPAFGRYFAGRTLTISVVTIERAPELRYATIDPEQAVRRWRVVL